MAGTNRRTFLARAGAGAAALALGRGARAAGPNDRINVAVVGVRGRGGSHVDAFTKHKATTVVALCDVDARAIERPARQVEERTGKAPKRAADLRQLLDDKDVDVVSIATPNHWHALATVWACQAGKDVYVEKPATHNVSEGRKMVEAARKHGRVVQVGTQNRSIAGVREAMDFLHADKLGPIFLARALCYKPRGSIGVKPDGPVPDGVDYDLWLGPAPARPFNPNRFHYEWHWNWDYGNGDIGNQGIHQMDVARWGLNRQEFPVAVQSSGGRYGYEDQGQTPNTQTAAFRYKDALLEFEVRGLPTNPEQGIRVGNLFYGPEGYLALDGDRWSTFLGPKGEPGPTGRGGGDHFGNFVDAVLSRTPETLTAPPIEGHLSSSLCHLANISYRLGRSLKVDPSSETFVGDSEADAMLTRDYREPFAMPESV